MSDSIAPIVTSVTTRGDSVIFEFEDGHRVIFEAYRPGTGYQIAGLRHFFLYDGQTKVVQYDSRLYREIGSAGEHSFVSVAEGYTVERIAGYWQAARRYATNEYAEKPKQEARERPEELWFPWYVTGRGWSDLEGIQAGLKPLPTPALQR